MRTAQHSKAMKNTVSSSDLMRAGVNPFARRTVEAAEKNRASEQRLHKKNESASDAGIRENPEIDAVEHVRSSLKKKSKGSFEIDIQEFIVKIKCFIKGNRKLSSLSSLVKSINSLPGFRAVIEPVARKPAAGTALRSEENRRDGIRITIHRNGKKWFQRDTDKNPSVLAEATARYMYDNYIKADMRQPEL